VPAGACFSENAALQLAHTGWVNIANLSVDKSIFLQSSTFSGTTWYNLSSVQTGLVVMLYSVSCKKVFQFQQDWID
jgi:hypothetical protein